MYLVFLIVLAGWPILHSTYRVGEITGSNKTKISCDCMASLLDCAFCFRGNVPL